MESRSKSLLHTAYLLTGDWEQGRDLLQTALTTLRVTLGEGERVRWTS